MKLHHHYQVSMIELLPLQYNVGHTAPVNSVQFSPHDAGFLASCSDDQTVKLWKYFKSSPQYEPFQIYINADAIGKLRQYHDSILYEEEDL